MGLRNYWLALFTGDTWQEFIEAGGTTLGFREGRRNSVSQFKPGDYLLCYLTGVSRFVAILEVKSYSFWDEKIIWHDDLFPCRVEVKVVVGLTFESAIPVLELKNELSLFHNLRNKDDWRIYFRQSAKKLNEHDGETIVNALLYAKNNPRFYPFDKRKLKFLRRYRNRIINKLN